MISDIKSREQLILKIIVNIILIYCTVWAVGPFIILVASSLTDEKMLLTKGYNFWPRIFSLQSYKYLFSAAGRAIFRAYGVTLFSTVVGTGISLFIGPMLAYPLSRRDYKRRNVITFLVIFTMLFNGGIVASYIMWSRLFHINNTIWAWIFPYMMLNAFNIILYRNYFQSSISESIIQAAKIDGAGEVKIFFRIVYPLSLPIIATVGLMTGLAYWNGWRNGLYYITRTNLMSLQYMLKSVSDNISAIAQMGTGSGFSLDALPSTGARMAIAVVGIVPVLALYPFFQSAFIKGISLGGVKE
jgi:putative aldouronate transport system permease protein